MLFRSVNEEVVIPRAQILEQSTSSDSMMPEGLIASLPDDDVRALFAYLASDAQVPMRGEDVVIDRRSHKAAGVLEGESLKVISHRGGNVAPQNMRGFGAGKWSGNSQLFWTNPRPKDELVLALPVESSGRYAIDVACTKAADYGVVQFLLDGEPLDQPIDFFNRGVIPSGPIRLGERVLEAGEHRLGVQVVGIRPEATKSYMFGLDWVRLVRLEE